MMKSLATLLAGLAAGLLSNPSIAQPAATGKLEAFGLQGKRVTALAVVYNTLPLPALLYAATEKEGVYRRNLAAPDSGWVELGLQGKKLTALDIQIWGAGPADFHAPVVGLLPNYEAGDSTRLYRLEHGVWVPADSGLPQPDFYLVTALASFRSTGHAPLGAAFAGGNGMIYRSQTFRRWWQPAFSIGIGTTNVLAVHQRDYFTSTIWAGGETGIFAPWLAKSQDDGQTWEIFYPDLRGDNACTAIAIHPLHPDTVYAGMEGAVIKTVDGGKRWDYTGLRDTPVYFHGLALDSANPGHIYAGGLIANPDSWALWESFDGGERWQEIPPPVLPTPVVIAGITSIVADQRTPRLIYIATHGHGVWRYHSGPSAIVDHRAGMPVHGFWLAQNVPNPFHAETVLRYRLAAARHVKLEVFDVLGNHLATLIDQRQPAGEYQARWLGTTAAGKRVAAGVYFYRLSLDARVVAMRKMLRANIP
ncbi:MAG: hypothetical protein ONB48_14390 [candidate division KSB1 bacterium]|nr:hypothetical protein [candidate division KSB1 bacterium]MDZ7273574.1 hypothetical protein [candidate division KSB1 bacterium]MDZ7286835.1 hypothetical protein [candidate division KSB1 bacterium]MDZ7299808.1 hypothetical protein [candidate division KSB1 bacterium]MDZ7309435.1 hypothetical protein [candidate division KSB1 bacterium]